MSAQTAKSERNIINALRVKFVAVIMAIVTAVLLVTFVTICVINYNQEQTRVYEALNKTLSGVNFFDTFSTTQDPPEKPSEDAHAQGDANKSGADALGEGTVNKSGADALGEGTANKSDADSPDAVTTGKGDADSPDAGTTGKNDAGDKQKDSFQYGEMEGGPYTIGAQDGSMGIPVAVYSVDDTLQINIISAQSTASLDSDVVEEALGLVLESENAQGYMQSVGLYYAKSDINGRTAIAFADASAVSSWQNLAGVLAIVGVCALVVFFLLALALSKWALRPVKTAWENQQQFIADASHEMKTPLTVILANTSIALKKPESTIEEQGQWIEGIQEEAQNMQELVHDMLLLTQLENGSKKKSDAMLAKVDLSEQVQRCALQFEAVAFERGISIECAVQDGIFVKGDNYKLGRLVSTLIDNACKYAAENTQIDVTLTSSVKEAHLAVHNFGEPIPKKDIPHVFDRFYRADDARDRSAENGTHSFGLGLAIARKIVEEHNGHIEVTSTAEDGTTFSVRLPM